MPNPDITAVAGPAATAGRTVSPEFPSGPTKVVQKGLSYYINADTIITEYDKGKDDETSDVALFIEVSTDKLKSIGIDLNSIGGQLGRGQKGAAYLYKGKVLKMTSDMSEVASSTAIVDKKIPGVVHIDRVLVFPTDFGKGYLSKLGKKVDVKLIKSSQYVSSPTIGEHIAMGWILQEKLGSLPVGLKAKIHQYTRFEDYPYMGKKRYFGGLVRFYVREKNDDKAKIIKQDIMDLMWKLHRTREPYEGFWEAIDALKHNGVFFNDVHDDNLMVGSDGKIKIIDLGISQTITGKKPEELRLEYLLKLLKATRKL